MLAFQDAEIDVGTDLAVLAEAFDRLADHVQLRALLDPPPGGDQAEGLGAIGGGAIGGLADRLIGDPLALRVVLIAALR